MSRFVKVVLAALLTVPLGAYVAGTLVASQAEMPTRRVPVVLQGTSSSAGVTPAGTPRTSPSSRPTHDPGGRRGNHDDSDDRRDDGERKADDDAVVVVRPTPHDVGDDHGGDRKDGRSDDDSGRHGSRHGGEDRSGKGDGED